VLFRNGDLASNPRSVRVRRRMRRWRRQPLPIGFEGASKPPLAPPPIHMPACPPGPASGCRPRPRPPSLAASAARAQVSAPAAVMMIDSPGSPRPLAARAPDRMPTLPPSPLMMVSSGGGAARGARWLRQLHHRMISRTLRAAVRHPIGCRAAVRGGLALAPPRLPSPSPLQPPPPPRRPRAARRRRKPWRPSRWRLTTSRDGPIPVPGQPGPRAGADQAHPLRPGGGLRRGPI
jgi:hypothetical protein